MVVWLLGSEGKGIIDVLVVGRNGKFVYDFCGCLSFLWLGILCLVLID